MSAAESSRPSSGVLTAAVVSPPGTARALVLRRRAGRAAARARLLRLMLS